MLECFEGISGVKKRNANYKKRGPLIDRDSNKECEGDRLSRYNESRYRMWANTY